MTEPQHRYRFSALWTDDAQGKKDYDGDILCISTRYWPRGGGFLVVTKTATGVTFADDSTRPEVKPSAKSSLILRHTDDEEYTDIVTHEFEGETFQEVAVQVERWAQEMMDRVVQAIRREFGEP